MIWRFPGVAGILRAIVLVAALAVASAVPAQQQPGSVNPSQTVATEQQLLDTLSRIEGRGTIPDAKSYVVEQPFGRNWRVFHEVYLHWIGGIAIVGIACLLAAFYLWRGPLRFGRRAGRTMRRFTAFERFVHWMTATCFVLLAVSGLNFTFGKQLLLPLIGSSAFSAWSQVAKYAHNYLSFPFTIGVVSMFLLWTAGNLPTRADVEWIKRGGGMFGGEEPPAYRFNAGEKLIFWIVVIGGGAAAASGYILLFPFYGTNIANMQAAQIVHSIVGVLYIAAMFVHVYMGSIGMEGAFEGMWNGQVDVNWARSHHLLWYKEEQVASVAEGPPVRIGARPIKTG